MKGIYRADRAIILASYCRDQGMFLFQYGSPFLRDIDICLGSQRMLSCNVLPVRFNG